MPFDVFISYAREDGDSVARPLSSELEALGVTVWLDRYQCRPGDLLSSKIARAIQDSRFAVVVLSPRYLEKEWTRRELSQLIESHRGRLIPLLRDLEVGALQDFSPTLANIIWIDVSRASLTQASPDGERPVGIASGASLQQVARRILELVGTGPRTSIDGRTFDQAITTLGSITAKHRIDPLPFRLADELANVFDSEEAIKQVITDAASLIAEAGTSQRALPVAYIAWTSPRMAWESALHEAAKVSPVALAAILLCARLRTENELEIADRTIREIVQARRR